MCAAGSPTGALFYGTPEELRARRPRGIDSQPLALRRARSARASGSWCPRASRCSRSTSARSSASRARPRPLDRRRSMMKRSRKWREDFPYESENDEFITRRDATRSPPRERRPRARQHHHLGAGAARSDEPEVRLEVAPPTRSRRPVDRLSVPTPRPRPPSSSGAERRARRLPAEVHAPPCPVAYERSRDDWAEGLSRHCHNGRFDVATGKGVSGPPRVAS